MFHILVAEDEPHIARLIEFKLSRDGRQVKVVSDGVEATEVLEEEVWSLIILDLMMPRLDGWGVLRHLRETSQYSDVPVLILTAQGIAKEKARAAEWGVTHFLQKPFDPDELSLKVNELLGEAK